jgi:hypothetical protein
MLQASLHTSFFKGWQLHFLVILDIIWGLKEGVFSDIYLLIMGMALKNCSILCPKVFAIPSSVINAIKEEIGQIMGVQLLLFHSYISYPQTIYVSWLFFSFFFLQLLLALPRLPACTPQNGRAEVDQSQVHTYILLHAQYQPKFFFFSMYYYPIITLQNHSPYLAGFFREFFFLSVFLFPFFLKMFCYLFLASFLSLLF